MTNMINSLPRFGLESANGVDRIFDYATGTYHTIKDRDTVIESTDGVWHAAAIAQAIKKQQQVFGAFLGERSPDAHPDDIDEVEHGLAARISRTRILEHDDTEAARQQRADKVEQAKEDFLADGSGDSTPQRGEDGLTEEERKQQQLEQTDTKVQAGASNAPPADAGINPQASNTTSTTTHEGAGQQRPPQGEPVQGPSGELHHQGAGEQPQQ
jgi:hypothetical protein